MAPIGAVGGVSAGTLTPGAYVAPRAVPTKRGLSSRSGHTGRVDPGACVLAGTTARRASGLPSPSSECVTNTDPSALAFLPTRNVLQPREGGGRRARRTKKNQGASATSERRMAANDEPGRDEPDEARVSPGRVGGK